MFNMLKVSPPHGWRAVWWELGIVSLGVLIALGAEQVVQSFHWRAEVETERASLLQEARDSLEVVDARAKQQGCVDRRLGEVRELLEQHRRGLPVRLVAPLGQPTRSSATRGTWEIALAGQALGHMPHDEKLIFSDAFGWFNVWDRVIQQEQSIWLRLSALDASSLLSEENWGALTSAYTEAAVVNERIRLLAQIILTKDLPGIRDFKSRGFSSSDVLKDSICRKLRNSRV